MIKLAISGACGRMGSRIIALSKLDSEFKLELALETHGHPQLKNKIEGIIVSDQADEIRNADCLIEFTSPRATIEHLEFALKYKKPFVIGTTGLDDNQKKKIKEASAHIAIIFSPNMSVGVNLLFKLAKEASRILSEGYKINITEAHHIHKKDAPSGTAKQLAQIVKGESGQKEPDIKSIREGEIIGDHKVIFDGEFDRVELSHSAKTRDIFASGALRAAKFIVKQRPGLYDMQDVLLKE